MINMQALCKIYDGTNQKAVDHVSVQIEKGEFFVLVGPSGCGKSTLLRMIAGLETISSGELLIDGRLANELEPKDRQLSMVFQNYALYPHLTVEENILFGLKVRKVPKEERQKRLSETAKLVGLADFLNKKPRQLSGGQRQRVALARAIVSQAPICLMDEPLSNLDAKLRGHMRVEIKEIQRSLGITMIYVTHDQVEAMTMGDRIMVLNQGRIQQIGSPISVYNHPVNEFVASFIGSPAMNLASAHVNRHTGGLTVGAAFLSLPEEVMRQLPGHHVRIGIRPEHVHVDPDGVEVVLKAVEVTGNETILSFRFGEELWSAKLPGQWRLQQGERVSLSFDVNQLAFFDPETKNSISLRKLDVGEVIAI
ncbi:ABC transporter ATP-binding protein [Brevibacillus sp. NRS-1366]|uniref:ABC transporter ATP-binding protein n=1 Tax=Brevibacillus sp. NRS-1366 TaxID=3233899 RepID=UPI003D2251A7